jgi:dephospho-CoA kinase
MLVGLTGGIASGKSQACHYFAELGIPIVDADIVARQVVEPGQPALAQIADYFGPEILLDDGSLNRRLLRQLIFNDQQKKHWLNQLLHPLIREQMLLQLKQARGPYKILVAPLLFENHLDKLTDRSLLIDVPVALQVQRTTARDGVDAQQAQQIIDAQMSRDDKRAAADDIIDNNQGLDELKQKVLAQHLIYLELAKSHDS